MGSRPARHGATGPVRHLDGGQWSIDALVQLAGDERRLGRCVAAVVATDAGQSRPHQAPGNLFGQRTEEFRSSDAVLEADGAVCRLVGVGDSAGVLSAQPSKLCRMSLLI